MAEQVALGFIVEGVTHTVVKLLDGVQVVYYLLQALCSGVARDVGHVCQVESAVEVEQDTLVRECLAAIGHGSLLAQVLRAHVLKPFAAVECQQQVLLLCRRLHHTRVGQDDGLILEAARLAVDHDTIEHTRVQVLLLHIDVRAGDTVVEDALRYLHFRTLLLHRDQQPVERLVGKGRHDVLEVE